MIELGCGVTVGDVRRELAELPDGATLFFGVEEGRGRLLVPEDVSVSAAILESCADLSFAYVIPRVSEELCLGPGAVVAEDALEVAWDAVAESGRCPLPQVAALVAHGRCSPRCPAKGLGAKCGARPAGTRGAEGVGR